MKKNMLFALSVLALAILISLTSILGGKNGNVAVVDVADAETIEIPLSEDGMYEITTGRIPVHLEVKDGQIRFIRSECPDHICEQFGWLSKKHDQATCAPAGVVVHVELHG